MNIGETVIHERYGAAEVVSVLKENISREGHVIQTEGLQVKLLTKEGIAAYRYDRSGLLPYLFMPTA